MKKCKITLKLIRFLTVSNLFILEVVHKCQRCQLLCITGKLESVAESEILLKEPI